MRAAIYARYSSDLQRDASIEDQVRLCRAELERAGWELAQVYTDRRDQRRLDDPAGLPEAARGARGGRFDVVRRREPRPAQSRDQEDVAALYKRLSSGRPAVTVAEGEITELHVGLKGTMNALFLKDLAQKTRRGPRGPGARAACRAAGSATATRWCPARDRRRGAIDPAEAAIVRRIFEEFAAGRSPRRRSPRRLNATASRAPRGPGATPPSAATSARGTGILNNELYVGRLVWNRQRYREGPGDRPPPAPAATRPRRGSSRRCPTCASSTTTLWERVKVRQAEIDAEPKVQAMKASRWRPAAAYFEVSGSALSGRWERLVGGGPQGVEGIASVQ